MGSPTSPQRLGIRSQAQHGARICLHTSPTPLPRDNQRPGWATHIATVATTRIEGLSAEEYIRQSLEDPTVFLADNFPAAMPKLLDSLSDQEYEELVQFLLSLE